MVKRASLHGHMDAMFDLYGYHRQVNTDMPWEATMTKTYPFPATAGIEPPLADLLADPVLHALLTRDRLSLDDVRAAIADWRNRRPGTAVPIPAAA